MKKNTLNTLLGIALLTGTMIGVGMFGLPYVASQAGILLTLGYMIVLGCAVYLIHKMYGEIILRTPGKHRFPGYMSYWLGGKIKWVTLVTSVIGFYGSLLAYIIVGGGFLASLLNLRAPIGTLIFFIAGSCIIFFGKRSVARMELVLVALLFILIGIFFASSWGYIHTEHLRTDGSWDSFFLPYGIILFSFWGASIVPEIREIVGKSFLRTLRISFILSGVLYALFTILILGVSGSGTTTDALTGLPAILGKGIFTVGLCFGLFAMFTSYISLGLTLRSIFAYDYGIPALLAFFLTVTVPLTLYAAGFDQFIRVISFVGAIALGIEGVLLLIAYSKSSPNRGRIWAYGIGGLFVAGVMLEFYYFFHTIL